MLTAEKKAYFEAFGFLFLPGLFSSAEMESFKREAEGIFSEDRQGKPFTGDGRHGVLAFAEKGQALSSLVEDDRIYGPIADLLDPDFMWVGSGGSLFVGDTLWHSDSAPDPSEYGYTRIKVTFYLDPVKSDTGCLRVIPGSHRPPLHEDLEPLRRIRRNQQDYAVKTKPTQNESTAEPGSANFGVQPIDIPGIPIESRPGDAVLFNQRLWHASFGGKTGRRMFALNYGSYPRTDDQVKLVRTVYEQSLAAAQKLQHTWTDQLYTDGFHHTNRPRIRRMMSAARELELK